MSMRMTTASSDFWDRHLSLRKTPYAGTFGGEITTFIELAIPPLDQPQSMTTADSDAAQE